jgi:histidinol dehydrogenase
LQNKVRLILEDVRRRGDTAVAALLRRHDGVDLPPSQWRVPSSRLTAALRRLPKDRRAVLTESARRVRRFHEEEKRRAPASWIVRRGGEVLGQLVRPVDAAGLYVPGGRYAYPSTVLMTAIPARVAGVKRVVVTTPPRHLTDEVLAAAALADVDELYQIGGVAAVGALAFGTATVPAVDLIAGPGGAWVTEAKRQSVGAVGIDMLAGPSEIVIVADRSARPGFIAADMMAQAEHDPLARSTLIASDKALLEKVRAALDRRFRDQCRFLPARDVADAVAQANALAPEHLSLAVASPERWLPRVRHAGAVFLGAWSAVAAGDYWAGPSHVLPTARSARFSSGLSVQTFWKRSSVIGLSEGSARRSARAIASFAEAEGLHFHAASVKVRGGAR